MNISLRLKCSLCVRRVSGTDFNLETDPILQNYDYNHYRLSTLRFSLILSDEYMQNKH